MYISHQIQHPPRYLLSPKKDNIQTIPKIHIHAYYEIGSIKTRIHAGHISELPTLTISNLQKWKP